MISAPDYIQFYPTLRCNLSCDFCFNQTIPSCDDITLNDFKKTADKMTALNIRTLDIIGGEPMLHNNLMQMLEYAGTKKLKVNLSSNGTKPAMLSEIMTKHKNINVGITINNIAALKNLKSFIKGCRPAVKTIFSNSTDTKLLNWINALKPEKFYLLFLDIMRKEHIKDAVPFPLFLISAQRLSESLRLNTVYCSGFIPDIAGYPELSRKRCPAGTTKLGLMPDGSVYPCNLFFGIEEFRLGNFFRDSFEKIWSNKKLDFFRTFDGNRCKQTSCFIHKSCHGGCPAHSLIHYGSLSAQEPRCSSVLAL